MSRLIVIPVRGGSVGIPNKATRLLGGVSPLTRTVMTALQVAPVTIITDNDILAAWNQGHDGVTVVREPANDGIRTLDGSVWAALHGCDADTVATVQCTSPLITRETIERCFHLVEHGHCDTAMTVRDDRHVAWGGTLTDPRLETPWLTRQALSPRWVMTGGCVATKRHNVTPTRRFGGHIQLVEVSGAEAVDLDAPADWALAEWYAGAPSSRELLMARVLGEAAQWRGWVVRLSAWSESPEEAYYRNTTVVSGSIIDVRGEHTAREADIALSSLVPGDYDMTVVTSAYHQPRAFLTFLRALQKRGLDRKVRLYNAPAPSRMDKLSDEWRKIAQYTEDVATYDEGLAYLNWRDSQVAVAA